LWAESKEDIKGKQDKLRVNWAKLDAEQEKWKADMMKAYKETWMAEQKTEQKRREAERKVYKKRMVEWTADQERRVAKRKAYEKRIAEQKSDQEGRLKEKPTGRR
jgi:hypothetical protein